MADYQGKRVWEFSNKNMFLKPNMEYEGSDSLNKELIVYNNDVLVTSSYGGRVLKIMVGGSKSDFDDIEIDSISFSIFEKYITFIDAQTKELCCLDTSTSTIKKGPKINCMSTRLRAIGNRVLFQVGKTIYIINPADASIKKLIEINYYIYSDIAFNSRYIFLLCGSNIFKIPNETFKNGNFILENYCIFDMETSTFETDWEF